jgi:hypothetical protein
MKNKMKSAIWIILYAVGMGIIFSSSILGRQLIGANPLNSLVFVLVGSIVTFTGLFLRRKSNPFNTKQTPS